jgi:hypothetical protein
MLVIANELSEQCIEKEIAYETMKEDFTTKYYSIAEKAEKEASEITANAKRKIDDMGQALAKEQKAWEEEKKRMAHVQQFDAQILLDVGGVKLATSLTTLQRFPDTMIGVMFSGRHALPAAGKRFFIDRDGTHFRHILNFLRQPEEFSVDLPAGQLKELKKECEYYGLLEVMFPKGHKSTRRAGTRLYSSILNYECGEETGSEEEGEEEEEAEVEAYD